MTRKEINRALPFWQSVLRLEDWTIDVRTVAKAKLVRDGDPLEGYTVMHLEELFAEIEMVRGATEDTLVHELLHIVHEGDNPEPIPYNTLYERALNRVAEAMMRLKTEGKK